MTLRQRGSREDESLVQWVMGRTNLERETRDARQTGKEHFMEKT